MREQQGLSAIISFALVIAILMMALGVYFAQQLPVDWKEDEYNTMNEMRDAFEDLQTKISGLSSGNASTVTVKLGVPAPTAMTSASTNAEILVTTARDIGDAGELTAYNPIFAKYRGYGTYVQEANPADNVASSSYDNYHLRVSTTNDKLIRTYLKFDLSDLYLYDSSNYVFYEDVVIDKAQLMLYAQLIDASTNVINKLEAGVPTPIEVWGLGSDAWNENINWDTQPHGGLPSRGDLMGLWHMSESSWSGVAGEVLDSSDNGNSGVEVNGANTTVNGKFGRAGSFDDASNSYVSVPDKSSLDVTENFTLEAWIYPTSSGHIISKEEEAVGGYYMYVHWTTGKVVFGFNEGETEVVSTDQVPFNTWTHVAGVWDGSNLKIYINGVLDNSVSGAGNPVATSQPLYLGGYWDDLGNYSGLIDDAAVWSRALTAGEIAARAGNSVLIGDGDVKIENQNVSYDESWVTWDVTPFVKQEFDKYQNFGKWSQSNWYDNLDGAVETGRFASGYELYENREAGVNGDWDVYGDGWLQSMIYDTGDASSFWNYVSYSYAAPAPTLQIRFDNDENMASPTDWIDVTSSGYQPNVYTRYAQYRVDPNDGDFHSITIEYTCHVSFVLREPQGWPDSYTLYNIVKFASRDNTFALTAGLSPILRVTYSRRERPGYPSAGLIDFGSIQYSANNHYMPDTNYTYEGGMVYVTSGSGWYGVTIAEPSDFIVYTEAEGNKINITVNRYQIKAGSVTGEDTGGTGYTSIRVQKFEEEYLAYNETHTDVSIYVNSDQPAIWRDYLTKLVSRINNWLGGEWTTYGPYAVLDYDRVGMTIYGKDLSSSIADWDIYYTERVIWVDADVGLFQGGRT